MAIVVIFNMYIIWLATTILCTFLEINSSSKIECTSKCTQYICFNHLLITLFLQQSQAMSNSSSSSSTSPYNFSLTADIVFGVVELTSSFLAFFLNSLTVRFFFGKKKSPTYFLYLCIGKWINLCYYVITFSHICDFIVTQVHD